MGRMSLEAEKNSLIRIILDIQDIDLIKRIKAAIIREEAADTPLNYVREEAEPYMSKTEVVQSIEQGLKEVKLYREGKLQLKTAEELLDEL